MGPRAQLMLGPRHTCFGHSAQPHEPLENQPLRCPLPEPVPSPLPTPQATNPTKGPKPSPPRPQFPPPVSPAAAVSRDPSVLWRRHGRRSRDAEPRLRFLSDGHEHAHDDASGVRLPPPPPTRTAAPLASAAAARAPEDGIDRISRLPVEILATSSPASQPRTPPAPPRWPSAGARVWHSVPLVLVDAHLLPGPRPRRQGPAASWTS
ncbi:hypothetical protein PR202_gb25734 [Eleusine coracana subsp. coracana]|uniref:Uncharacterized protein n=1 Tax=Eleusine coracana subsp. coracana TaxID=191504 RepID=A0AAV5FQ92_ELECO|nr:hypothetical protein PR202_gb25734 [Eleusine coracana subsp. coracana]